MDFDEFYIQLYFNIICGQVVISTLKNIFVHRDGLAVLCLL
jgi:hypothetical protein